MLRRSAPGADRQGRANAAEAANAPTDESMRQSDEEEIKAANRAFYRAFAAGDVASMDALWARERPVACIHPGGPVLASRPVIMDSWASVLFGAGRATVNVQKIRVFFISGMAFVTCYERVGDALFAATNVYAREQEAWKMMFHQSTPALALVREACEERLPILH